jgi:hypothetical protein
MNVTEHHVPWLVGQYAKRLLGRSRFRDLPAVFAQYCAHQKGYRRFIIDH